MIQFPNKIYVDKHLQQALPGKKQTFVKYIELVNKYSKNEIINKYSLVGRK